MGLKTNFKLGVLYLRHVVKRGSPFFKADSLFKDKKIIIVGPASSSLEYLSGKEIDKFDFIVRINNGTLISEKNPDALGSRTDILFHCMTPCLKYGWEAVSSEVLKRQKVRFVLHPHSRKKSKIKFFQISRSMPHIPLFQIEYSLSEEIHSLQASKEPTTGLMALVYFLRNEFKELHITGFTFFKTNYINDYAGSANSLERIKQVGSHDPQEDLAVFIDEYMKALAQGKSVILDEQLQNIVQSNTSI